MADRPSTGQKLAILVEEIQNLRQEIAPLPQMGRDLSNVKEDIGIITLNVQRLDTKLETELKHLATRADLAKAISDHKEKCKKRNSNLPPKSNGKIISILLGAIVALTAAVTVVVRLLGGG